MCLVQLVVAVLILMSRSHPQIGFHLAAGGWRTRKSNWVKLLLLFPYLCRVTMPEEEYSPGKYSIIPLMVPCTVYSTRDGKNGETACAILSVQCPHAKFSNDCICVASTVCGLSIQYIWFSSNSISAATAASAASVNQQHQWMSRISRSAESVHKQNQ